MHSDRIQNKNNITQLLIYIQKVVSNLVLSAVEDAIYIFFMVVTNIRTMTTPVLNKKQQKSTLSAKKTKPKVTIKNVVATPYNQSYWPKLTTEDNNYLKQVLQKNLKRVIKEKINTPWQYLKNVAKEDRKKFRQEYTKQEKHNKSESEGQVIGINDVTKLLERNRAEVVLITSDVQPKIMVQHVIDQCVLCRVPILILEDLRSLLKSVCGIGGVALALSKDVDTIPQNKIKNAIRKMYAAYPPPTDHINYERSLEKEVVDQYIHIKRKITPENKINEKELLERLYLKRTSKDKRTFVPENKEKSSRTGLMGMDSTGFLPFSLDPMSEMKTATIRSLVPVHYKKNNSRINDVGVDSTNFLAFSADVESSGLQIPQKADKNSNANKMEIDSLSSSFVKRHFVTSMADESNCEPEAKENNTVSDVVDLISSDNSVDNEDTFCRSKGSTADIELNLLTFLESPNLLKKEIIGSHTKAKSRKKKGGKIVDSLKTNSKKLLGKKNIINKSSYKSLKVKRLKGDQNRNKRKIAVLKSKIL